MPSRAGKGGAPPPAERRAGWGQVVNFDFPATPKLLVPPLPHYCVLRRLLLSHSLGHPNVDL